MTTREFLIAMKSVLLCDEKEVPTTDELLVKADELIASLDHRNEKRKSADSKEKKEASARRSAVLDLFKENPVFVFTRAEISEKLGITPGQATAACTALVKDGYLDKTETKIDKSKHTAYMLKSK